MTNARRTILSAAIAIAVGAAACGDDTTEPEDSLTVQEATNLLEGYRALFIEADSSTIEEAAGGAIVACPHGGRFEAMASVREEQGDTSRLHLDIRITPSACSVSANGDEYTLTGDPNVHEQMTVEIVGFFASFTVTGSTVGAVTWESGDRSGRCEMDLVLAAEPDLTDPNNPGVNGTLSGMLCGHEVEIDVDELPIE